MLADDSNQEHRCRSVSAGCDLDADRNQLCRLSVRDQPQRHATERVPFAIRARIMSLFGTDQSRRLSAMFHEHVFTRWLSAPDPQHVDTLAVRSRDVLGCYMRLFPTAHVIVLVPAIFVPFLFVVPGVVLPACGSSCRCGKRQPSCFCRRRAAPSRGGPISAVSSPVISSRLRCGIRGDPTGRVMPARESLASIWQLADTPQNKKG